MASSRRHGMSRREVLRAGTMSMSLVAVAPFLLRAEPAAQQKVPKAQVQYQDSPKEGKKCADCAHFLQPNEFTVKPS